MISSIFLVVTATVAVVFPLASHATVLVELTGQKTVSGTLSSGLTAFQIALQSGGKQYLDFDPRLGTVQFSNLAIGLNYQDNTSISFGTSAGMINTFNASVSFPLLGSTYTSAFGSGWLCPAPAGAVCAAGGGQTLGSVTLSGAGAPTAGFIPGNVTTQFNRFQGNVTGSWSLSANASLDIGYNPFTRNQYLSNLIGPGSNPSLSELKNAVETVKELRGLDAATSGQNLELRNAEYYLRGRIGAQSLRDRSGIDLSDPAAAFDDVANLAGPVAAAIYNGKKIIDIMLGRQTAGDGQLPNTPPGGFDDNWQGYVDGLRGHPLPGTSGGSAGGPLSILSPSTNPDAPLQGVTFNGPTEITAFYIDVPDSSQFFYFDPTIQDYLTISSQGSAITSFILVSPSFHGLLKLFAGNQIFDYTPGSTFSFLDALGFSVFGFGLSDFPDALVGQEADFGLQFDGPGETIVMALSGFANQSVPEPTTWLLVLTGFGLLGLSTRRRTASAP